MDFVAIDTDIAGDRVTYGLSSEAKVSRREAVGILVLLFAGIARHADDGDLSGVLDAQIEDWCLWDRKPGTLAPVLRRYLCDAQGVVREWDQWNGKMIRRAKAERERLRQYREDKARTRTRTSTDTRTEPVRDGVPSVLPDLTRPDLTKPTTETTLAPTRKKRESGPRGDTWLTPIGAAWEAVYGAGSFPYPQAARELAPLHRHHASAEIARRLAWYLENKGSEAVLPPDRLAARHFTPSLKDFRLRFGAFDPSADAVPVRG